MCEPSTSNSDTPQTSKNTPLTNENDLRRLTYDIGDDDDWVDEDGDEGLDYIF